MSRPCLLALALAFLCSCNSIIKPDARWADDVTGTQLVGVSSGWAFVESDVTLENGEGPLADPVLGGNDRGASTTDLDPVFGIGLKYLYYLSHNWSISGVYEHRIFDPDSTRPLEADVDLDEFGTNHFILGLRYTLNARGRWRPYFAIQLGYVPEVSADGTVDYGDSFASLGFSDIQEEISLNGSDFFTLGLVAGASYLLRDNLSFDASIFYETTLNDTEDTLELTPTPGTGILGETTTYDGSLNEEGVYLAFGLSWYF